MTSQDIAADRMVKLARDYRAHLAEVRDFVRATLNSVQNEESWWNDVNALHPTVHKVAGSAAIYGYVDVGAAAQGLEAFMLDVEKSVESSNDHEQASLLLARLLNALNGVLDSDDAS